MQTLSENRVYSNLFSTVDDAVGHTILEMSRKTADGVTRYHRFAVMWDEDRDTRIIGVMEKLVKFGVAHAFLAFGEHEGNFTAILTPWAARLSRFKLRKLGGLVMKAIRRGLEDDIWWWTFGSPVPFDCPPRVPFGGGFYQGYESPLGYLEHREAELGELTKRFRLK